MTAINQEKAKALRAIVEPYRKPESTAVCIASGPSLNQEQIDVVGMAKRKLNPDRFMVIGCNDNWQWRYENECICDHVYAADTSWWEKHIQSVKEGAPGAIKWVPIQESFARKHGIIMIPCRHGNGLGKEEALHCMQNSGAQIINLAYQFGASKIILIGYDMKVSHGANRKVHWFGDHPKGLRNTPNSYTGWVKHFVQLAKDLKFLGVDLVNCTPDSALDAKVMRQGKLKAELLGL